MIGCGILDKPKYIGLYDQEDHLLVNGGETLVCPRDGTYISNHGASRIDETSYGMTVYLQEQEVIIPCKVGEEIFIPYDGEFWGNYYSKNVVGAKVKIKKK